MSNTKTNLKNIDWTAVAARLAAEKASAARPSSRSHTTHTTCRRCGGPLAITSTRPATCGEC